MVTLADENILQVQIQANNDTKSGFESFTGSIDTVQNLINNLTRSFEEFSNNVSGSIQKAAESFTDITKASDDTAKFSQEAISSIGKDFDEVGKAATTSSEEMYRSYSDTITKLESEVKGLQEQLDKLGTKSSSGSQMQMKNEGLGSMSQQMDDLFAGMSLEAVGAPLVDSLKKSIDSFAQFDQSMRLVNEEAKLSQQGFTGMESSMLNLSNQTGISANDLAQGLYNVVATGLTDTTKAMDELHVAADGAKAGNTDLNTSTRALNAVMGAYGMTSDKSSHIMDVMFTAVNNGQMHFQDLATSVGASATAAATAGVSYEELAAAQATLTNVGKSAQSASQNLNSLITGMIAPTAGATKEAKALGIEWDASALKAHGLTYMIDEATRATGGNEATLKKLVPNQRAYMAVLALGGNANKQYTNTLEQMKNANGATAKALEEYDKGAADNMEKMKTSVQNAGTALATTFAPAIISVSSAISGMAIAFQNLSPDTQKFIGYTMATVGGLTALGGSFLMIRSGLGALVGAFKGATVATEAVAAAESAAGVGTTALGAGFTGMLAAAAPWLIAGAAVVAIGYGIYKVMYGQATPAVNLFADSVTKTSKDVSGSYKSMSDNAATSVIKISDTTKKAVGEYLKMDEDTQKTMTDISLNADKFSTDTKNSVTKQFSDMTSQVGSLNADMKNTAITNFQNMVTNTDTLTENNKVAIIQQYANMVDKVDGLSQQQKLNVVQNFRDTLTNSIGITQQQANTVVQQFTDMGTKIKTGMDTQSQQQIQVMQQFFAKSSALSTLEEQSDLTGMQKYNDAKKGEIDAYEKQISDIYQKATSEHRNLTKDEQQQVNTIQDTMKTQAVKSLSDTDIQSKVILERMKSYGTNITAQQAGDIIKNANKQRDGAVKAANDQYDKVVANIIYQRDVTGQISGDQAEKLIKDAGKQRDDTITAAETQRKTVVEKITSMNTDVGKSIDLTTGNALTSWQKFASWWDSWHPDKKTLDVQMTQNGTGVTSKAGGGYDNGTPTTSTTSHSAKSRGYATGSLAAASGWALVGEKGPELINFGAGGQPVMNNRDTMALFNNTPIMADATGNSSVNIIVNVSGNITKNERDLADMVSKGVWDKIKSSGKIQIA